MNYYNPIEIVIDYTCLNESDTGLCFYKYDDNYHYIKNKGVAFGSEKYGFKITIIDRNKKISTYEYTTKNRIYGIQTLTNDNDILNNLLVICEEGKNGIIYYVDMNGNLVETNKNRKGLKLELYE